MADLANSIRAQLGRQVAHWSVATARLQRPGDLASEAAWGNLEQYLGVTIRQHLKMAVQRLQHQAAALKTYFETATTLAQLEQARRRLLDFRRRYLRTETMLDFYADAINTRTSLALG